MCMKDYEILSGDTLVAIWENGTLSTVNQALLPLFLKNIHNADTWLSTRAIDSHRTNSRLLKKALRMTERDDVATVLRANGVTITDNYWVREIGSNLKYEDVRFDSEYFTKKISKSVASLAINGSSNSFAIVAEKEPERVAELTNIGSFEKCWKNEKGAWWLYKKATKNEAFSEIFISNLCGQIGISCAQYEKASKGVKTLDFCDDKFNFEPAVSFMQDDEDYERTIQKLKDLCPQAIKGYIQMIFLDALVYNQDRHTQNFGLLRDRKTGEFVDLAPCFDHNIALISRDQPKTPFKSDLLIELFNECIRKHPEYKTFIPVVTESAIDEALKQSIATSKPQLVKDFILFRYSKIEK